MKVSYKWLDNYFDKKLPAVEKIAEVLTMNSQEVDGVEKVGDDYVLDVKITPNMAHSCLCHRGIARELSALLDLPLNKYSREIKSVKTENSKLKLEIKIQDAKDCRRYIGQVIENIKIGPSPEWLKSRLETLGQRSINNLVDATNFVMLEVGQPMHVFDADKIGGNLIEIRKALAGDEIRTLDGKDLILDESVLVISNNSKALAIAGIKGGTVAEIDNNTKNIILESANFDPVLIRKTAQKLKIQTEASKRYENELTPEIAFEAMNILSKLICEIAGTEKTKLGSMVDIYPSPTIKHTLVVSAHDVEKVLGLKITNSEIEEIFKRFDFAYKTDGEQIIINVPAERLDLRIKEDLIEEIGRVYGYNKLKDSTINISDKKAEINKNFYYAIKIKKILIDNGFSEIYGYAFSHSGKIELANSVAPEKKFLRFNLTSGMIEYLEFNTHYSELVSMPQIKIFEIGKVFEIDNEHSNFVIGVKTPIGVKGLDSDQDVLNNITVVLEKELNVKLNKINQELNIAEFNFDDLVAKLPMPIEYDIKLKMADKNMRFRKISAYPFILRDLAVFTPVGTNEEDVLKIIKKEAGDLLVKERLFDVFTKKFPDGSAKTSLAYRLVFQSYEKTLSDDEVNKVMDIIVSKLNDQKDWQVR